MKIKTDFNSKGYTIKIISKIKKQKVYSSLS